MFSHVAQIKSANQSIKQAVEKESFSTTPDVPHLMFASDLGIVQLPAKFTASMGTIPALPVGTLLNISVGTHAAMPGR